MLDLGCVDYEKTWRKMQQYTLDRNQDSPDQIWFVEHQPVYTLGLNGKAEHILKANGIPIVKTDRGGQVTYHGPGQLVLYLLLDLNRLKRNPRQIVTEIELAMINTLSQYGLKSHARSDAPGVYIGQEKIGSVGLRIKQGCCYHGLSLNNQMDLLPFETINPCGYAGLKVTQLADQAIQVKTSELAVAVAHQLLLLLESS